jgi:hypothetical protein
MAGNGESTPYQHIDMTPEYNRIITALTGIRDDIRLLQTLQSDPESGITTNNVLNDFQRAVVTVAMSSAGSNTAAAVAAAIDAGTVSGNGGGVAAPSGDSNADLATERASILEALGQDTATQRVLMRELGFYYWEAQGTAGPDDGSRGSTTVVTPFAQGELLGFDDEVSGQIIAGSPSGPPDQIPNPSKPRKRWPFARAEGSTASQISNPNADLVDPATGEVVPRSAEDQTAANTSGEAAPPIISSLDQAYGIFQNPNATPAQTKAAQDYVAENS